MASYSCSHVSYVYSSFTYFVGDSGPATPLKPVVPFIDYTALDCFVVATNAYAESKRTVKHIMYRCFELSSLTNEEMMHYVSVLLLFSINSTWSYRQAWDFKSSQVSLNCECMSAWNSMHIPEVTLHYIYWFLCRFLFALWIWWAWTISNPSAASSMLSPWRKKLNSHMIPWRRSGHFMRASRSDCLEFYHLLQELSIDEHMVKSKARTHICQYIRNKPTKWGIKYWVVADPTGTP